MLGVNYMYIVFQCELSPRSETIKSRCYTHFQLNNMRKLSDKCDWQLLLTPIPMAVIQII